MWIDEVISLGGVLYVEAQEAIKEGVIEHFPIEEYKRIDDLVHDDKDKEEFGDGANEDPPKNIINTKNYDLVIVDTREEETKDPPTS